jgi:hypothetical protein
MGKSMYNYGNQGKEKARQQKQMEKAAKRITAKQLKADIKTDTLNAEPLLTKAELVEKIDNAT